LELAQLVRAGLLEHNTVELLKELGVGDNLVAKGIPHHGVMLSFNGDRVHIPFEELTGGRSITIYGQRFVVRDLIANLYDKENVPFILKHKPLRLKVSRVINPLSIMK